MSQSLSNILLHLVFSTKNRANLITPDIEDELYAYITAIHKTQACPLLQIGGISNHLHILCRLERTVAVSDLIAETKRSSSKWIKTKDHAFSHFAWQNGYGAFSIGESNVEALTNYINTQKQHHQTISFEEEYRLFLKKYKIEWDERYVWDLIIPKGAQCYSLGQRPRKSNRIFGDFYYALSGLNRGVLPT